jgi:hypothetical protein
MDQGTMPLRLFILNRQKISSRSTFKMLGILLYLSKVLCFSKVIIQKSVQQKFG